MDIVESTHQAHNPPPVIGPITCEWPGTIGAEINDIWFAFGDDYIELYGGYVEKWDVVINYCSGNFTQCNFVLAIHVHEFEADGKLCIRSANKDPVNTKYSISSNKIQMKMIIEMKIVGHVHTMSPNYCIYKLHNADLSFMCGMRFELWSFFDKITDDQQKQLLKFHLAEYFIIQNIRPQLERHILQCFDRNLKKARFYEHAILPNITTHHVMRLHIAFNNLAKEIVALTNLLLKRESSKVYLTNLIGVSLRSNNQKVVKTYEGLIRDLNHMTTLKSRNAIVSKDNDLVIVDVPVGLERFNFLYKETTVNKNCTSKRGFKRMQTYTSYDAYFCLTIERLSTDNVAFELRDFRIVNLSPALKYDIKMTIDYLNISKIEDIIKECLKEALLNENLQEMAINPDFGQHNFDINANDVPP